MTSLTIQRQVHHPKFTVALHLYCITHKSGAINLSIYLSMALQPLGPGRFFTYTQSVGLLGREISPSQGRYLHTEQHKQNKRTQTSMPRVGFDPTIPAFERAKTIYALDRAATGIGGAINHEHIFGLIN
jgi:hypothetical protein